MKKLKIFRLVLLVMVVVGLTNAQSKKARRFSNDWKKDGPEKSWNSTAHEYFYKWRNDLMEKRAKLNDQILRRQKAILNGNKITTEIWNYGSISSPGNRVTDIVWEGLGYGYEFGPFIGAVVPVPAGSHQDAYQKIGSDGNPVLDDDGNPIWLARVISDGLVSLGGEISPDGKTFYGWEP